MATDTTMNILTCLLFNCEDVWMTRRMEKSEILIFFKLEEKKKLVWSMMVIVASSTQQEGIIFCLYLYRIAIICYFLAFPVAVVTDWGRIFWWYLDYFVKCLAHISVTMNNCIGEVIYLFFARIVRWMINMWVESKLILMLTGGQIGPECMLL